MHSILFLSASLNVLSVECTDIYPVLSMEMIDVAQMGHPVLCNCGMNNVALVVRDLTILCYLLERTL